MTMWNSLNNKVINEIIFQLLLIFSFASANYYIYSITISFFLIRYAFVKSKAFIEISTSFFFAIFLILVLISISIKTFIDPFLFFKSSFSIIGVLAAAFFVKDINTHYISSAWALMLWQSFVLLNIFYYGFENFPAENPVEKIFIGKSGNGVTSYTVVLQIHFFIFHVFYKHKKDKILYISIIFTLLISASTYARGSLSSALMLVFFTFFIYKFSKYFLVFCTVVSFMLFNNVNSDEINDFYLRNSKFSQGFKDNNREIIVTEYLNKIDFTSFFIGADFEGTIVKTEFNGNPHNTFVRAHQHYGIFYLLFIFLYTIYSVLYIKKIRRALIFIILLAILIFRAWTETVFFPTIFDFYFFSIIFSAKLYG